MATQNGKDPRRPGLQRRLETVAELLEAIADPKHGKQKQTAASNSKSTSTSRAKANPERSESDLLHDLRVACRRAETALKACRHQLSQKKMVWFRDLLRSLRQGCTPLRDDEVFHKWLKHQPVDHAQEQLLESVSDSMHAGRKDIVTKCRSVLRRHHFRKQIQHLLPHTGEEHDSDPMQTAAVWKSQVGRWLFDVLNHVIQAIPATSDDYDALHQLRIAVKGLRYGLEYAVELNPGLTLLKSLGRLQTMQDKLGELHDAVVRLQRIESECAKKAAAENLFVAAESELQQCAANWDRWWQPAVLKQLVVQCVTEFSKLLVTPQ